MKTESHIFGIFTACMYLFAGIYGWWTWYDGGTIEYIGFVALILTGTLTAMCWGFFAFIARRMDLRPEDRADGEIADAAGEVGFFSPGSYWPFGVALCASVTGIGVVFWQWWIIAIGGIAVIVSASGLIFEYYTGTRKLGPQ
ncbi:cytochrome c oxidase subunit 4 [Stackebrandtia soli]|uniref:cytochrome c oxidase subunit 4 n=1 Tax=Stackebrandtia soli TaxID=1892856 RepID=UPI0039EC0AAD